MPPLFSLRILIMAFQLFFLFGLKGRVRSSIERLLPHGISVENVIYFFTASGHEFLAALEKPHINVNKQEVHYVYLQAKCRVSR
jgi:hypothetical protein